MLTERITLANYEQDIGRLFIILNKAIQLLPKLPNNSNGESSEERQINCIAKEIHVALTGRKI